MERYEVIVIGAGPAGYPCAIRCAQYGMKVLLVEKDKTGGCCLNTGCIPTKTLFNIATILKKSKSPGLKGEIGFEWEKVLQHVKTAVVSRLRSGVEFLLKANGVEYVRATATINQPYSVNLDGKTFETKKIVIATGAKPSIPEIFSKDPRIITTDTIWNLEKLPETLAIVGGGPVGCEFASILSYFGVKITIYEMLDSLLPKRDREIVDIVEKEFTKKGIQIKTGAKINSADEIPEEKILWAAGRKPEFEPFAGLGLKVSSTGIDTDTMMKTALPDIYAAGDITGKWQLAYVATRQGEIAASNCAGKEETISYENIPETIFTIPEIACTGLTQQQAESENLKVKIGRFPYTALGKAYTKGETSGMAKVIVDAETEKILGVHIIGENATEIIHPACVAMSKGMTVKELLDVYWSHPTFSEILMEALSAAEGMPLHIPKR